MENKTVYTKQKAIKNKVVKVKTVRVKVTTPFRYAKKEHSGITRLPVIIADWMVEKRFGEIL